MCVCVRASVCECVCVCVCACVLACQCVRVCARQCRVPVCLCARARAESMFARPSTLSTAGQAEQQSTRSHR